MRSFVNFAAALAALSPAVLWAGEAAAEIMPHRAEYVLRLGPAANAPRIGTAVSDLTQDCAGWHLKRDIKTEIALTASWKMSLASKLDSEETRNAFRYGVVQTQNGNPREIKGKVQRQGGEMRAEVVSAGNPPNQFTLPPPTLLPVAAIAHMVDRLGAGAAYRTVAIPDQFQHAGLRLRRSLNTAAPDRSRGPVPARIPGVSPVPG